jgi:riboflavin synthase
VPQAIKRYIAHKGSICVDGVSLTVNAVKDDVFDVNIIPHTLNNTIFGDYQPGTRVNLEVDVVARYVERMLGERVS